MSQRTGMDAAIHTAVTAKKAAAIARAAAAAGAKGAALQAAKEYAPALAKAVFCLLMLTKKPRQRRRQSDFLHSPDNFHIRSFDFDFPKERRLLGVYRGLGKRGKTNGGRISVSSDHNDGGRSIPRKRRFVGRSRLYIARYARIRHSERTYRTYSPATALGRGCARCTRKRLYCPRRGYLHRTVRIRYIRFERNGLLHFDDLLFTKQSQKTRFRDPHRAVCNVCRFCRRLLFVQVYIKLSRF